jgi:hypothetical protein
VAWLTRSEHRLVHQIRYELYGDSRDLTAANQLAGEYTDEEVLEIQREVGKRTGPKNAKIMHAKTTREQRSEAGKIGIKITLANLTHEQRSKGGKITGPINGKIGGKKNVASGGSFAPEWRCLSCNSVVMSRAHAARWHIKPGCVLLRLSPATSIVGRLIRFAHALKGKEKGRGMSPGPSI